MHRLPAAVLPVIDRLQAMPVRTRSELEESLAAFERALAAGGHHPFADAALADRMAAGCRQFPADGANQAPDRLRFVQVAVDHLGLGEDAEPDTDSILGFDGDAAVFEPVARALGREDLTVGVQLA